MMGKTKYQNYTILLLVLILILNSSQAFAIAPRSVFSAEGRAEGSHQRPSAVVDVSNINIISQIEEWKRLYEEVFLLNCGGTIDMSGSEGRSSNAAVAALMKVLKNELAAYQNVFDRSPDSSNIGPEDWVRIIEKVHAVIKLKQDIKKKLIMLGIDIKNPGGIVIAHGTDTLAESAYVLSLEFSKKLDFPIVLTGAHAPPDQPGSDAIPNLMASIQLARMPQAPQMVYIVLGDKVHLGSRARKVMTGPTADDLDYFESYGDAVAEILPDLIGGAVIIFKAEFLRWAKESKDIPTGKFGYVEHLVVDNNTPLQVFLDTRDRLINIQHKPVEPRCGLIFQGNFCNHPELKEVAKVVKECLEAKIPVITGSRRTKKAFEAMGMDIMFLPKYFSYQKARTKLSWILRMNVPMDQVERALYHDAMGDTAVLAQLSEHPGFVKVETFPSNDFREGREVIKAFPGMRAEIIRDAAKRLSFAGVKVTKGRKKQILIYGFGDGNLPVGMESIPEIVEKYLNKIDPSEELSLIFHSEAASDGVLPFEMTRERLIKALRKVSPEKAKNFLSVYVFEKKLFFTHLLREAFKGRVLNNESDKVNALRQFLQTNYPGIPPDQIKGETQLELVSRFSLAILLAQPPSGTLAQPSAQNYDSMHMEYLINNPHLLAERLMKDALMESNGILREIGNATDNHIEVWIRTDAVKSRTNTRLYELGNKLMIVGAKSDDAKGWETILFRIEKNPVFFSPEEEMEIKRLIRENS